MINWLINLYILWKVYQYFGTLQDMRSPQLSKSYQKGVKKISKISQKQKIIKKPSKIYQKGIKKPSNPKKAQKRL